jgi:hypothetical protein
LYLQPVGIARSIAFRVLCWALNNALSIFLKINENDMTILLRLAIASFAPDKGLYWGHVSGYPLDIQKYWIPRGDQTSRTVFEE